MRRLSREQEWKLISLGSAIAAAVLVRAGMKAGWKVAKDEEPPLNPLRQDSDWSDAIVFAFSMGVGAGLARLAARALADLARERRA